MVAPREQSFETQTTVIAVEADAPTVGGDVASPRLVCVTGADAGKSFPIDTAIGTCVVIGRYRAGVSLTSVDVSRRHAQLTVDALGVTVEDLRSVNGTYLNGIRVNGPSRVRFGDRLQVGSTVFVLSKHDELEQRMQRVQRLEAMGTLSAGIAHDFNNALMVILANLEHLAEVLAPAAGEVRDSLDEMHAAASSSSVLARRLLRLGRTEHVVFDTVPLFDLVDNAMTMMKRGTSAMLVTTVDVDRALAVHGVADDLHHMMLNVLLNARDAMPDGGTLKITARIVHILAAAAPTHDVAAAGDYVEIIVSDSGCGMDEATLARAFEPFFTTKSHERGTGLGMAMIHGIVRRHGGAIELMSWLGSGTNVKLLLPRALVDPVHPPG